MANREIITIPHPTLRKTASKITKFDDELQTLIADMVETMREGKGVGLAAPQVNVSQRVITVEFGSDEDETIPATLYVVVNPEIINQSKEEAIGAEGCLSVPGLTGDVARAYSVTVRGKTKEGNLFKMNAKGWLARIFQHEIDHLNGILFTDRAEDIWETEAEIDNV